jgi:hypothetical protein
MSAQQTENKHFVSLNCNQETLSAVLNSISEQTGLRFSYNTQLLDTNKKININVSNKAVEQVLQQVLPQNINFKFVGKHIILSKKNIPQQSKINEDKLIEEEIPEEKTEEFIDTISLNNSIDTIFIQEKTISDNGITSDSCHNNTITIKNEEMKKTVLMAILSLSAGLSQNAAAQQEQTVEQTDTKETVVGKSKPFQLTFVYPLGTDGSNSANNEYGFSLNILGGRTGKVNGVEIGGIFNMNKIAMNGVQIAGVFNNTSAKTGEKSNNVQIAGFFNHTKNGNSTQIAGFANAVDTAVVQIAGFANISSKSVAQIGGFANVTYDAKTQIGGFFNLNQKAKVQISGGVNMTETAAVQIGGIFNYAEKNASIQIGGILNKTKKGGFQIGLINIRDSIDGVSVGLINIVKKNGIMEAEIGGGEFIHTNVAFRSGSRKLYSIISLGANFESEYEFLAVGFGLGTRFFADRKLNLDLEAIHYQLYCIGKGYGIDPDMQYAGYIHPPMEDANDFYQGLTQLRPVLNINLAKHFKIYVGPTFNLLLTRTDRGANVKAPYSLFSNTTTGKGREIDFWIGATAGFRF